MSESLQSLISPATRIKVSSTLDKSAGKENLIDDNLETCWTSQQGLPQYIQVWFAEPVIPKRITLTFQGGFVGTQCAIQTPASSDAGVIDKALWHTWVRIYPEDVNRKQVFDLEGITPSFPEKGLQSLKLLFEESSDFFGRIIVYSLKLEGTLSERNE